MDDATPLGRTLYEPSANGPLTETGPTGEPVTCVEPVSDPVSTIENWTVSQTLPGRRHSSVHVEVVVQLIEALGAESAE